MSMLSFNHILALSLSWHTKRKTGELLRILDRGSAVNRVGELIAFTVLPALVDVIVALVAFVVLFEVALGVVVGFVMIGYIWATVVLTRYRTRIRRQMNDRDVVSAPRTVPSSGSDVVRRSPAGFTQTVFSITRRSSISVGRNMRRRGMPMRLESIRLSRRGLFVSSVFLVILTNVNHIPIVALNVLNLVQTLVITSGLLVGSIIVASRITKGESDTSGFVIFITYYAQVSTPLSRVSIDGDVL